MVKVEGVYPIATEAELRAQIATRNTLQGSRPGLNLSSLPNKYSEYVHARIVQAIEIGGSLDVAALYAGISRRSLQNWITTGEADIVDERETVLARLVLDIERARGDAAIKYLTRIENAPDWRAAKWKLETMFPEYRQNPRIVVNNANVNENGVIIADGDKYESALRAITGIVTEIRGADSGERRPIMVDGSFVDRSEDTEEESLP